MTDGDKPAGPSGSTGSRGFYATPRYRQRCCCASALLSHLSVTSIPVDPVRIARRQGLVVEEGPLPSGVYGALWKKGNRFGIIVSDACPTPGHRRFSLAHYHIDGHLDAMFAGATGMVESAGGFHRNRKSRLEREADWFASELLVPAEQLVSRIEGQPASIRTLESLADEFQTSLTMMAIRHAELTAGRRLQFSPAMAGWNGSSSLAGSPGTTGPASCEGAIPSRRAPQP